VKKKLQMTNEAGAGSPLPAGCSHGDCRVHGVTRSTGAFTLIEVLMVVALLSLIVIALMAVFNSTQSAFRASVTQADVLEGGRAAMDLIGQDLKQAAYTGVNQTNVPNFYVFTSPNAPLIQSLIPDGQPRTNVLEEFFFLTRQNQTWNGIGYFVATNADGSVLLGWPSGDSGSLYRFEESLPVAQNPKQLFSDFQKLINGYNTNNNCSKLLDGAIGFKIRMFNTNGFWLTSTVNSNLLVSPDFRAGEYDYQYYSNALPVTVEIEMATLEDRVLQHAASILDPVIRSNYLSQQAGKVHVFRQRDSIPNVDPAAYQ
jgi:type II secretory pathway pseudopilin PulG